MSTPWTGDPRGDPSSWGGSYGGEGPVDPYAGQAAALPPPHGQPYGQPGPWQPGPWQPAPPSTQGGVPGLVIAGSVVAYLFAAMLFVSGLFLLFFGSVLGDAFDEVETTVGDGSTSLLVAGFGNWLAMVLLVTGAIMVSVRRAPGLVVTAIATALVLLLAVYWVAVFPDGAIVFWAFVHVLFALAAGLLILLPPRNRAWLGPVSGRPAAYGS